MFLACKNKQSALKIGFQKEKSLEHYVKEREILYMNKFFTIFFALLTLILTSCSSSSPDPQVTEVQQEVENQLDLEHVKNTEEEEKRMEELLAALDAEAAAEEPEPSPTVGLFGRGVETESKAQPEQETIEVIQPEVQKSDGGNIIEKGLETLKNLLVPTKKEQKEQEDDQAEKVAVIVSPMEDSSPTMFMPESPLALQSAIRLIPCKIIPEKMEVIYQRLQKTKGLNIADRRLRDRDNDRLMPVVHFDFDQIIVKPDYKKLLQQQTSCVMKALGSRGDMIVQIEGHADERGSDEYNMALGHRRADVIAKTIMAYYFDSKLARIFSYGEEFPLDRQSSSSAWAKNRRVEFTLLLKP